ncbi:MAG: tRNA (adenosine(37)-N6)-dimethylallyltransferase MiaA [Candidatus Liptonbacteria bacterium GWB1_49_6]|uniref:tRNA dimethylallyltransferase n=1 Tax=Candidatus Liptonbacteria bacterium GWB1_49_6 TaxID=1798644 RepID=A0A1G2C5J0_9BACT|nr:MAG: tRNA (adenosine(37)-N6)-dimethylallyltransferase MiaA [Candidatus Liptonbacteria bacterium GWB1_49_6]
MSSTPQTNKILVILGPTASGKSALAVSLARQFNGEIISADSRQVYRGMDIGTGKVPRDNSKIKNQKSKLQFKIQNQKNGHDYKGIRHHLLDVASPKRTFTVAQYQKLARAATRKILKKQKLPIIVGGTGFYIDALLYGYALPKVKPNPKLRRGLEKKSAEALFLELQSLDPARTKGIDRHNRRRLIRALEIIIETGSPVPPLTRNSYSHVLKNMRIRKNGMLKIGIQIPAEGLKKRIHKRLLGWLKRGLLKEIKKLRAQGVSWKRLDGFGLEYREASRYLRGLITKAEMIKKSETEIWRYAKRQMTWWKRDKEIVWLNNKKEIIKAARRFVVSS